MKAKGKDKMWGHPRKAKDQKYLNRKKNSVKHITTFLNILTTFSDLQKL